MVYKNSSINLNYELVYKISLITIIILFLYFEYSDLIVSSSFSEYKTTENKINLIQETRISIAFFKIKIMILYRIHWFILNNFFFQNITLLIFYMKDLKTLSCIQLLLTRMYPGKFELRLNESFFAYINFIENKAQFLLNNIVKTDINIYYLEAKINIWNRQTTPEEAELNVASIFNCLL